MIINPDIRFYDTCSLLLKVDTLFDSEEPFVISSITLEELENIILETQYTRYPVYEEDLDHVCGLLHVKDLYAMTANKSEFNLKSMLREVKFFPETVSLDKLVRDFIMEVYKDKLIMRKEYIEKFDIDNWYEEKCILSNTLKERSETTSAKLKQVIMKIMQDSGLVIKEKTRFKIVRPLLKEKYISMLDKNGDLEYAKAIGGLL